MADQVTYTSDVHPAVEYISRVKWSAVFAGLTITMATQVLLTLFGLAVGLSALNPVQSTELTRFGTTGGIWLTLTTLFSVFIGAWATSWLANTHEKSDGIVHGILNWALFLLLALSWIGSGMSSMISGAFNMVTAGVSAGATQSAALGTAVPATKATATIQRSITRFVSQAGPNSRAIATMNVPANIKTQIAQKIISGDDAGASALISQHTGLTEPAAMSVVQGAILENRQVAQNVTETAGKITWGAFWGVVVSLLLAALGGYVGTRTVLNRQHHYTGA